MRDYQKHTADATGVALADLQARQLHLLSELHEACELLSQWHYQTEDHVQRARDTEAFLARHGMARQYPDETN